MMKAEVTVLHAASEMDIVAEKENETRYLLNGGNASSVKVGSDVYVNINGKDSDNGVVVEWGGNCIVEEDHEAVEKPVQEKEGYVKEKLGDGDDCLANGIAKQSASEAAVVIDSSVEQSDDKVDDLVNGVSTDDDATHKVSVNSISSNPIVSIGGISFVVDVQSNQYNGNLADLEMASKLVGCRNFDDEAERETPFNYMIRVPRNEDERLKVMIRLARNKVDEKIQIRRMLHIDMQSTWVTSEEYRNDFSDAVFQEQVARDLHRSKCQEIEWMQSVIDIEDIEVKSLKKEADQLRANLINAVAITEATKRDMADQLENKASEAEKLGEQNLGLQSRISELKIMLEKREKEIFILTKKLEDDNSESFSGVKNLTAQENNLLSENETLQAEKALLKENFAFEGDEASNQVQRLMDEANTLQQQLESLHMQKVKLELQSKRKKQKSSERLNEMDNQKSELKQMVEDLQRDLEAKGDEKNDLLMVQVEKFMDLWNNNDAFQKEYVRCNERSTLWRLRTLDGRSLGPGEVPPVIPQAVNGRAVMDPTMFGLNLEGRTQEEVAVEKAVKEQRWLEEIAKAKEALERKRRMVEKAEAREAK
ncbi:hypothetical protein GOBAR_AA08981 [Gossypium barbadense]|uniref:Uncharacterized protein n=1 Tax=Gossypium barbadense TaxID=3634 RepID=A0A2P5Y7V0_GOSBA|nr:hypothetical protein GOBAR_AA08981 [Gossypium barbadense]